MSHQWLHLRLAAPLMAFGSVAIDHVGPTREFPSASALTGLLANALGLRREERARHQALQDRLIFGALSVVPEGRAAPLVVTDTRTPSWRSPITAGRHGACPRAGPARPMTAPTAAAATTWPITRPAWCSGCPRRRPHAGRCGRGARPPGAAALHRAQTLPAGRAPAWSGRPKARPPTRRSTSASAGARSGPTRAMAPTVPCATTSRTCATGTAACTAAAAS